MVLNLLPLLLLPVACSYGKNPEHKLEVQNCTSNGTFANASNTDIYYHIVGSNSSCMHFAWSTVAYPTLFVSHAPNCTCNSSFYSTNYTENQTKGTVKIPGLNSGFSLAIIFRRLIEFNGTKKGYTSKTFDPSAICNDTVLENGTGYSIFDLRDCNMTWSFHPENSTFVGNSSLCDTRNDTDTQAETWFSIRTNIPKLVGNHRLKYFPKTLFTKNSATFDIISEDYPFKNSYSRLVLEVMIIHGKNVRNGSVDVQKTTDDEYTPSVFSTYTYNTSDRRAQSDDMEGGYLQWKPISYQSAGRKSTSSQQVKVIPAGSAEACQVTKIPNGLASALFGSEVDGGGSVGNVTRWFVVFGTPGDTTYLSPSYNTWTVVVGRGDIPFDTLSPVVITTILVGVGVPAVLVLVGGVYVFIKKKPWENVQRFLKFNARGYTRL